MSTKRDGGGSQGRLGDQLLEAGLIEEWQLLDALNHQKKEGSNKRLGSLLVELGFVSEKEVVEHLIRQRGRGGMIFSGRVLDLSALKLIPREVAEKYCILPIRAGVDAITLALEDPSDEQLLGEVRFMTGKKVVPLVALDILLKKLIPAAYEGLAAGKKSLNLDEVIAPEQRAQLSGIEERPRNPAAQQQRQPSPRDPNHSQPLAVPPTTPALPAAQPRMGGIPEPTFELDVAPTILIVEDNPDTLRIYSAYLTKQGFIVRTATRGRDALAKVETFNPDLVVLDAMLPEIHGFEICRQLKSSERYAHIPVIIISAVYKGWGYNVDVKQIYGADAYLTKPIMLDELVRHVREHLEAKQGMGPAEQERMHAEGAVLLRVKKLLEEGRAEDAVTLLTKEVEHHPNAARLHYALGAAWTRLGDDYKAIASLERAVELDAEYFTALRNLAALYQRKNLVHKAVEALSRSALAAPSPELKEQVRSQLLKLLQ